MSSNRDPFFFFVEIRKYSEKRRISRMSRKPTMLNIYIWKNKKTMAEQKHLPQRKKKGAEWIEIRRKKNKKRRKKGNLQSNSVSMLRERKV